MNPEFLQCACNGGKLILPERVCNCLIRLWKRSERGQAVSELVISLIGVSLIVLGTIMVSVMGISGIRNLIDTRSEAERKMNANAFGDVQANHITEWVR